MIKIILYHYSNKDIKDKINPFYFGYNTFTNYSQELSGVKRSYFYLDFAKREYFFSSSQYLYRAEINKNKLYNFEVDPLKIRFTNSTDYILRFLKRKGYKGFYLENIAQVFYPLKIKDKITLTK